MMFKSHVGKKQEEAFKNRETVEQFLARGGKIQRIPEGKGRRNKQVKKSKSIDPQALLTAAMNTPQETEVINFLKSQGFQVE